MQQEELKEEEGEEKEEFQSGYWQQQQQQQFHEKQDACIEDDVHFHIVDNTADAVTADTVDDTATADTCYCIQYYNKNMKNEKFSNHDLQYLNSNTFHY